MWKFDLEFSLGALKLSAIVTILTDRAPTNQ
jgi:hypothetical protein